MFSRHCRTILRLCRISSTRTSARAAVAARGRGDVELELLVAGVGALLPKVPLEAAGPQVRTGHSPLDRLIEGHRSDAHGAGLEYAVLHHDLVVLVEPLRQVIDEVADELVPSARQILGHSADAEPARVHPPAA